MTSFILGDFFKSDGLDGSDIGEEDFFFEHSMEVIDIFSLAWLSDAFSFAEPCPGVVEEGLFRAGESSTEEEEADGNGAGSSFTSPTINDNDVLFIFSQKAINVSANDK